MSLVKIYINHMNSYQEIRSKDEVKHKHMSDRELKAKNEAQPTR